MAEKKLMDLLLTYGWAILIIIVVVGALWKLDVFDTSSDYKISCTMLCEQDGLNFDGWDVIGGCKVCKCSKLKQLTCED